MNELFSNVKSPQNPTRKSAENQMGRETSAPPPNASDNISFPEMTLKAIFRETCSKIGFLAVLRRYFPKNIPGGKHPGDIQKCVKAFNVKSRS
jgi:hypothetical protein